MIKVKRKTIKNEISFSGIGLHKGEEIHITLKPSTDNSGIIFKRTDVEGNNKLKPDVTNLVDLERGTNIKNENGVVIYTIEHLMSALHISGITDIYVEIDGNEMPILDGCSYPFIQELEKAGIRELDSNIEPIVVKEPLYYSAGDGRHIVALPYDGLKISYTIDFNHSFLKAQYYEIDLNYENYINEIAKARTFCFDYEIEYLQKNNLALGGSLENAIVIKKDGVVNPDGLRYENEFVRHKIMDLIGDIYILNKPVRAHIIAIKARHFVNSKLSEKFKNII